jgi:enoyl-CoA hydratase/carnithine racemase
MMARLRLALGDEDAPARDTLTPAVVERLLASLEGAPEGCVITLEGRGDSFCQGLSPEALAQPGRDAATELVRFGRLLHAVDTAPGPVVALVNGPAMGGGLGLAAAADLVLAAPDARFGLPEVMLGLVPAMVFPLVARRIGVVRARSLALGATTLSAAEATTVGLVDVVTEHLEETLEAYLRRFRRMDRRAMAAVKALAAGYQAEPASYPAAAVESFVRLLHSDETRARLQRFVEGGAPWGEVADP